MTDDPFFTVTETAGLLPHGRLWELALDSLDHEEPLDALRQLGVLERKVGDALVLAVAQARAKKMTWRQIGDLLGVSPQAAHQRFSKLV